MVEVIRKWQECAREECTYDSTWCANIDDNTMIDEVLPSLQLLMKLKSFQDAVGSESADMISSLIHRCGGYLSESKANKLDKCIAPPVDHRSEDASMHARAPAGGRDSYILK